MAVRKNYREYNTVSKSGTGTSSWIYLDHFPTNNKLLIAYRDWETDRKSTRLNSSHSAKSRMPSSA